MNNFNYQPDTDRQPIIVAALRTPIGKAHGALASLDAIELCTPVFKQLIDNMHISPSLIDEVILGNAAGGGGNVARLAALAAGFPIDVPGLSVDRQCGSGLETIALASRLIQSGAGDCYLAGGVESVSTAPWRAQKPKHPGQIPRFYGRARFSTDEIGDPDMGVAAENVATKYGISRERQDAFALESHRRAIACINAGKFHSEIVPLQLDSKIIDQDECPRASTSIEALSLLKPVFVQTKGTVTAGNSCTLNDGACAVIVMARGLARKLGVQKGLRFVDATSQGVDPNLLGIGPVASTRKLLKRQPSLDLSAVKIIEFNEAFASQVLASLDQLSIDSERVNKEGGAIAIGHPFGASGSVLVTRLFHQSMQTAKDGELCIAMLGIAGGMGLSALFQWCANV